MVLALVASEVPEGKFFWGYLAAGAQRSWQAGLTKWCYLGLLVLPGGDQRSRQAGLITTD